MALREIRVVGDELLRKKSKVVREITPKILELLDDMRETLTKVNGLGLAAPQVGVLKRVVLINIDEIYYELVNPEIIETDGTQSRNEGCLSIPGKNGTVERPLHVKVRALNRQGEEIFVEGEELLAVALCHEIDHLDGILYVDKATEIHDIASRDDEEDEEDDEEISQ